MLVHVRDGRIVRRVALRVHEARCVRSLPFGVHPPRFGHRDAGRGEVREHRPPVRGQDHGNRVRPEPAVDPPVGDHVEAAAAVHPGLGREALLPEGEDMHPESGNPSGPLRGDESGPVMTIVDSLKKRGREGFWSVVCGWFDKHHAYHSMAFSEDVLRKHEEG